MNDADDSENNRLDDTVALPMAMREPHQARPPVHTDAQGICDFRHPKRSSCPGPLDRLGHLGTRPRRLLHQSRDGLNPASLHAFRYRDPIGDRGPNIRGGLADRISHERTPENTPSLRSRLSRFFHSNRKPKGEEPLSLLTQTPQAHEQGEMPHARLFVQHLTNTR